MKGLSDAQYLAACAASGAYLRGFAAGADPRRSRRRHVVDSATHAHWLRGYDDGRTAAYAADSAYMTRLASEARAAAEVTA